ncbi:hypothetical protein N7488_009001 [Penicillium malachiteum]|nr:hypothetical protein N7488_009001 [Penicillium malachiteum]
MEHPDHDAPQFYEDFLVENDQLIYTDLDSETDIHQEAINPDWYPAYFPTDLQLEAETVPWEAGPREAEASNNLNHLFPDNFAGDLTSGANSVTKDYSYQDFLQDVDFSGNASLHDMSSQSSQITFPESFPEGRKLSANDNSADERPGEGKKRPRLPRSAVKVLSKWLSQNQLNPYPTEQDKKEMEQQTGLDRKQILTWFTNARRRKIGTVSMTNILPGDHSMLSPMERWRNSPPEAEPATVFDIMQALENTPYLSDNSATQFRTPDTGSSNGSSTSSFLFGEPSIGSYENSHSSGSELRFQSSDRTLQRPPTPLPGMRHRRHRRKTRRPTKQKADEHRAYQCTFCSASFRNKYDWQRHEKALHVSVDRWMCAPHGDRVEIDGVNACVFCCAPNPDENHLETHNYLACRENVPHLRTFSRKDHLQQHLRLTHNALYHSHMDIWRVSKEKFLSRCGFCDSNFTTWEERVDHVAEHFKKGADMGQWKGGWGFEMDVESLVENALPPYLLGQERRTMDPCAISDERHGMEAEWTSLGNIAPNGFDRYTNLRQALLEYVRGQIMTGNYPSDGMIQDEARIIAYADDDPWNQTYADDQIWLDALKHEVGMISDSQTTP